MYEVQRRFTEDQIRLMRKMRSEGKKLREIANFFKVSVVSIHYIVTYANYAHVD